MEMGLAPNFLLPRASLKKPMWPIMTFLIPHLLEVVGVGGWERGRKGPEHCQDSSKRLPSLQQMGRANSFALHTGNMDL